jgi:3-oxoacyl-[acyl-carrier protein] reductase
VVGCSRSAESWEAPGFQHITADVTVEKDVAALFREIGRTYGRLDAAINNAAQASMNHLFLTPLTTVDRIMNTNVGGTFLVSREAAKLMRKRKAGRIVNFTSAVVPLRLAGEAAYIASKAAVTSLSQVLARELAEFGITVNVVGPSMTDTDMIRGVPKPKIEHALGMLPLHSMTTFEDIANVIDFFLKPESSGVSGQVIYLGGASCGT